MPVTENGFEPRNEDDIFAELSDLATSLMGEDIDTSEASVFGQFLRLIGHEIAKSDQYIEAMYLSWFYDSATGVSLDRVAALAGLTRNGSQPAYVTLSFTGKAGTVVDEDDQFETEDGQIFAMEDVVTLDASGKGSGTAVSLEETDDANVAANTITEQVMPVEELTSVTNPEAATGGATDETDEDFRQRITAYETASTGSTVDGIRSAVRNVTGVDQVEVIVNSTTAVDSDGNPPKSIHIYVTGGNDADIAQAINDSLAAGTQTVGQVVTNVVDDGGNDQVIKFDRPTAVPIFMTIKLQTDSNLYETDGAGVIKQNIQNYISGLTMGSTIRFTYLYTLVYNVIGVVDADIKIGRVADTVAAEDIKLSNYEAAAYSSGNIEVTTDAD
ncbi:baseplate J/gp47 family protein [Lactiplantibacillus plantarum]|uniref:baseplate J/gp47 family protein n=1 Tax=Lactiplantibacillus plantarum TaxID=1590 RepID=UPI003F53145F